MAGDETIATDECERNKERVESKKKKKKKRKHLALVMKHVRNA